MHTVVFQERFTNWLSTKENALIFCIASFPGVNIPSMADLRVASVTPEGQVERKWASLTIVC